MKMNTSQKPRQPYLFWRLRYYFSLKQDKEAEPLTIENIRKGVDIKGANLWVLIFAILIASIGLNTNSTAVIIGAMLISPLMGPIMGVGFAVGINDMELMKRSLRSIALAALFSILAATLYFLFSPLDEEQSELLSRTSPTIYDVFIALVGGLAGILAVGTKGKGSVIVGVAIATALMPPLCTVGFGLAAGKWLYALGAFYLFFINSVFISIAAYIGVFIFGFSRKQFENKKMEMKVRRYIIGVVIITICPALYLTYGILKETVYTQKANYYINSELNFEGSQIIEKKIDPRDRIIQVILFGNEVREELIANAERKLPNYSLTGTRLTVIQGKKNEVAPNLSSLRSMVLEDFYKKSEERIAAQQNVIDSLRRQVSSYEQYSRIEMELTEELKVLFPDVCFIAVGNGLQKELSTGKEDTLSMAYLQYAGTLKIEERLHIEEWLKVRIRAKNLKLMMEQIP